MDSKSRLVIGTHHYYIITLLLQWLTQTIQVFWTAEFDSFWCHRLHCYRPSH